MTRRRAKQVKKACKRAVRTGKAEDLRKYWKMRGK